LSISQTSYITSSLQRYGFEDIRYLSTPMDSNIKLSTSQSPQTPEEFAVMKNKPYREAVGTLMYASLGTRPDITYAVGILSKFNEKPGLVHWNTLKRVYAYLAGTRDVKLTFGARQADLMGYADQGGTLIKIRYLGSNFFSHQVLGDLPTYVIRHIAIYGNMTSSLLVLSAPS